MRNKFFQIVLVTGCFLQGLSLGLYAKSHVSSDATTQTRPTLQCEEMPAGNQGCVLVP